MSSRGSPKLSCCKATRCTIRGASGGAVPSVSRLARYVAETLSSYVNPAPPVSSGEVGTSGPFLRQCKNLATPAYSLIENRSSMGLCRGCVAGYPDHASSTIKPAHLSRCSTIYSAPFSTELFAAVQDLQSDFRVWKETAPID